MAATLVPRRFSQQISTGPRRWWSQNIFSPFRQTIRARNFTNGLSEESSSPSSRVKVAVVGSGRMGHIRARAIFANPQMELVGIVDPNLQAARSLGDLYHVPAVDSLNTLVSETENGPSLQGIVCSSPTTSHRSVLEEVTAEKISYVFVEKPVEASASKIRDIFHFCSNQNIRLCCGFQRRFDRSYQSALEQLPSILSDQDGGPPEPLIYANIFFGDHPVPPMEFLLQGGGDIFMDLSAHDVDYILQALPGQSVVSVYATGTSSTPALRHAGVHDNASMTLTCSGGSVVTLFLSRSAPYGYDQRAEFFGRGGRIQVGNHHETSTVVSTGQGIHQSKYQYSFPQRFEEAFANEMDNFASLIRGDLKEWLVTQEDCIRVQEVADAAQKSASTGEVVYL